MLLFACSGCGKNLQIKDDLAGKRVKCPLCGNLAMAPVPMALAAVSAGVGTHSENPRPAPGPEKPALPPSCSALTPFPSTFPSRDLSSQQGFAGQASSSNDTQSLFGSGSPESVPTPPPENKVLPEYDFLAPPQNLDELGRLGTYRIHKVLGTGGMGVVFEAEDTLLQRQVAIKVMLPAIAAQPANRQRFLREAQAAASIEHDHIVAIFQVGEDRGVPFLAMPLLRGESLDTRVKREGKLPVAEVLRIGRETADGLSAAHERGLVHRDIKPANLWLEGKRSRVKILDFGLVRPIAKDNQLTQSGVIMGSPGYLAPEQARGKPVDHRSDLFSLGCVLYRMATGKVPFKGRDMLEVLTALVSEEPRPVREANAEVPLALESLVMWLLAKDPAGRPPSAQVVVDVLRAIEEEQATDAKPPPPAAKGMVDSEGNILGFGEGELRLVDEDTHPPEPPQTVREEPASNPLPANDASSMEGLVGQMLGHFEIGQVLGYGLHGIVFHAQDRKRDREVALKVLAPEFPRNDLELAHFTGVMKAMLPVGHPRLVKVYGVGRIRPYSWMALEYFEGKSLNQLLQEIGADSKKPDWRRALRVAIQIGRALEFASRNNMVHGNVTPQNILWQNSERVAKLGDMMFLKALEGSRLREDRRAEKRRVELAYQSPEQAEGDRFTDELSDLYGLGAVVYALLTGRPPFEGDSAEEVFQKIRKGGPARPTKVHRGLPAEFEWVVMTLLAKDRRYRIQTPMELVLHLERIALEEGIKV